GGGEGEGEGERKEVGGSSDDDDDGRRGSHYHHVAELERRVEVLTAQNAALRTIVPPPSGGQGAGGGGTGPGRRQGTAAEEEAAAAGGGGGQGRGTPIKAASITPMPSNGAREASLKAWELEKKLRRRIESLERRLDEKGAELQAAEGQAAQARDLLARVSREKEVANRKLKGEGGRASEVRKEDCAWGRPSLSVQLSLQTRSRLFQLEEENTSLRRAAELQLPQEIEALKHQVHNLRDQLAEMDSQLEEAEIRAKNAEERVRQGRGVRDSGSGLLREEEKTFHELLAARDEIVALKATRRELEGQVLDRDATNVELRFDLEARAAEVERLRRRVAELQMAAPAAGLVPGGDSKGGGGAATGNGGRDGGRQVGGRFKRERDLEGIVDALKRVVEKLRGENDRLRRGAAEGVVKSEAEKVAREARRRAKELQQEVASLRGKASAAQDAVQRLAQKQDTINRLRRQLRAREEEINRLSNQTEELDRAKAALETELETANDRIASDLGSLGPVGTSTVAATSTAAAAMEEAEDLREEAEELRKRLGECEKELEEMGSRARAEAETRAESDEGGQTRALLRLEADNQRLGQENERLNRELQAFDLDFFEEIEDLKYKYSEAIRKLEQYEPRE
ncbi:unnamed protein product, partial [Discosporangium mesarthrocarpum]